MSNINLCIYGSKVFLNIINELNLNYNISQENNVNFDKKDEWSLQMALLTGIIQFISFPCGIGWMWSISHGITLY